MRSLPLITALAWRNLWRNKRRTAIILFAMMLGIWAMIVTAAFMRGISIQVLDDTVKNLNGHIQIHQNKYLDDPVLENSFFINESTLTKSLQHPDIIHWSSRIRVPAVVVSEYDSSGLSLVAINPQAEAELSFLKSSMSQGRYFTDSNDKGVIIGKKLADNLETKLGKRIVLMSQDMNNEVADRGYRVIGIYDTPTEGMETGFIFMTLASAESLLNVKNISTEITILTRSLDHVDPVLAELKKQNTSKDTSLDIQAWHTLQPFTKLIIEMYGDFQYIWHLIVFLAMSFGIINTLLMSVFERTREFGLFQALGLKPYFILAQVWVEAIMMLFISLILGNLVSWLTVLATGDGIDVSAFAQGMEMAQLSNIIPFVIISKDLILANTIVIVLGLLTGLYPAWHASQLVPADAITRI
ncbi:MAG: ABC transporter permease [Gammaproteobacteria bacterium]|nr:ABC transporter permease [Gammaproteobacteria bacterium]